MTKSEFKEKYFIQEDGDLLSPTSAFCVHSEQILRNVSTDQDMKEILVRLNEEAEKCFRLLENAIFENLN